MITICIALSCSTPLDPIADVVLQQSSMDNALKDIINSLKLTIPQYILSKTIAIGHDVEELPVVDRAVFKKGNKF